MTEIELNERIRILLTEQPVQQKRRHSRVLRGKEMKVRKDDRLLAFIRRYYMPYAGYVDGTFEGKTLLHSGKYMKYPKNSNHQRWMKRLTSKRSRQYPGLIGKGNQYRRLFDYWWNLD